MDKELILTCDAGTTGCKCSVFDARGVALCSVKREYETEYPKPNWAEQNMARILAAIYDGIRELLTQVRAADIACVGLSGTMNGCVAVDAAGQLLYPNIIHSDSRSWREAKKIEATISGHDFYQLTGNRLDHHFTLPKILWLREHRPDVYKKTRWWLNTKDYIYGRMTGHMGVTDYSDASLSTMLDIKNRRWATDLVTSLHLDVDTLPEIRPGHDVSGLVTRETAALTGLLRGTPVAIGGGDGACAGRGAGLFEPGSAYCCIGSSAWVSQLTRDPLLDDQQRIFNYLDMNGEVNHTLGVIQTGAAAYDWGVNNLLGNASAGDVHSTPSYYHIESMARQIEPGAEGVLFLNTLMGERTPYWDPNTRGCLIGFSLYHDQRHVARAIYEGVAMSLNQVVQIMKECGHPVKSIMLTGGGARSGLWPDIFASVFNQTTSVHMAPGEATSLGAAIAAGVGIGVFKSYEQAASIVHTRSVHEPNPAWAQRYEQVFQVYRNIYTHVKPLFDEINDLT